MGGLNGLWGVRKPCDRVGKTESLSTLFFWEMPFLSSGPRGLREPRVAHSERTGWGQSAAGEGVRGSMQACCMLTVSHLSGVGEAKERLVGKTPRRVAQQQAQPRSASWQLDLEKLRDRILSPASTAF